MVKLKASEGGVELVRAYPEKIDEIVGDKRAYKQILSTCFPTRSNSRRAAAGSLSSCIPMAMMSS